jgi:hypothetical protein
MMAVDYDKKTIFGIEDVMAGQGPESFLEQGGPGCRIISAKINS